MTSIPPYVSIRNLKNKDEGKTVLKSGRNDTLSIRVFATFLVVIPKCLAKLSKEGFILVHGLKVTVHHGGEVASQWQEREAAGPIAPAV